MLGGARLPRDNNDGNTILLAPNVELFKSRIKLDVYIPISSLIFLQSETHPKKQQQQKLTLHKLFLALLERHLDRLEHLSERVSERNPAIEDFKVECSSVFQF